MACSCLRSRRSDCAKCPVVITDDCNHLTEFSSASSSPSEGVSPKHQLTAASAKGANPPATESGSLKTLCLGRIAMGGAPEGHGGAARKLSGQNAIPPLAQRVALPTLLRGQPASRSYSHACSATCASLAGPSCQLHVRITSRRRWLGETRHFSTAAPPRPSAASGGPRSSQNEA